VKTLTATGHIHIEKLQEGCQKLKILRITNSQVSLTPVPLKDQMASPGFPQLEELSVACMMNSLSSLTQPFVDDEAIERILKSSTKLKLLDARNCSKVTDSSLVRVPAWDLTHLYLSGTQTGNYAEP
jgi:F-box/leucine-rich repeat protein 6